MVEGGGGAVGVPYRLAVGSGGEAGGVAVRRGLDKNGCCLSNGVVECEGYNFAQGVMDGFTVGLLGDGLAASATRSRQDKRRYEGSR